MDRASSVINKLIIYGSVQAQMSYLQTPDGMVEAYIISRPLPHFMTEEIYAQRHTGVALDQA